MPQFAKRCYITHVSDTVPAKAITTIPVGGGSVVIRAISEGKSLVSFTPSGLDLFVPRTDCETGFPLALLSQLAETGGSWICEWIARYERADYVQLAIKRQVEAYFEPAEFQGKRLLDFGCGGGASTFLLAGILPQTEVVGVELAAQSLEVARLIEAYRGLKNVSFFQSPSGLELPAGIGQFDFIMLSAVWEHLLPEERPVIAGLLWKSLKPGGALLINQTPYRWAPFEHHTTSLWGVNYLPDSLACWVARHWSRQLRADLAKCDWPQLLRRGIRGGTEREVLRHIRSTGGKARMMQPRCPPHTGRAGLWLSATSRRLGWLKRRLSGVFSVMDLLFGTMPVTHVDVVFLKS